MALLAGATMALLVMVGPATARAAECDYRAIGNAWGDDVGVSVCLNYDGHGADGTWAHAYARIEARGTRNPVRSCEARVSVTLSNGTRRDVAPAATSPALGSRSCSVTSNVVHVVIPPRVAAVAHGNASAAFYLGSYSSWYWMNTWEWGGAAHSPPLVGW